MTLYIIYYTIWVCLSLWLFSIPFKIIIGTRRAIHDLALWDFANHNSINFIKPK